MARARPIQMPSSKWGDEEDVDPPATMPLVSTPLIPTSISFLILPREIRDMIYRHLLSTRYTESVYIEPEVVRAINFFGGPILT